MSTHLIQIELEVTTCSPPGSAILRKQNCPASGGGSFLFMKTISFREHVPLAPYSNYKIGGEARYFFEPRTEDEVVACVKQWRLTHSEEPLFVLGGGTNILISDDGFRGLVLRPRMDMIHEKDGLVIVEAGASMEALLNFIIAHGLTGLEWAGGLPGTVGGAVRGNAGAFGGETKDSVREVMSLDIASSEPTRIRRTNSECHFNYRTSIIKERDGKEIILSAVFALQRGNPDEIRAKVQEKIQYRKDRHPMEYPNIGSVFKNVDWRLITEVHQKELSLVVKRDPFPVVPTAYLISAVGLKGMTHGGAMISPKHPNFIVNMGNATANDVKELIQLVKMKVKEQFGVELEEEIMHL